MTTLDRWKQMKRLLFQDNSLHIDVITEVTVRPQKS